MCAVSAVTDYWQKYKPIAKEWEPEQVRLLKEILERLKKMDESMNQKDCPAEDKKKFIRQLAEASGVNITID